MIGIEDIVIPERSEYIPDIFIIVTNNHPTFPRIKGHLWEYPFPEYSDILVLMLRYPIPTQKDCYEDLWVYFYFNTRTKEFGFFHSKNITFQYVNILKFI